MFHTISKSINKSNDNTTENSKTFAEEINSLSLKSLPQKYERNEGNVLHGNSGDISKEIEKRIALYYQIYRAHRCM